MGLDTKQHLDGIIFHPCTILHTSLVGFLFESMKSVFLLLGLLSQPTKPTS